MTPAAERRLLALARTGDRTALNQVAGLLAGPAYRYGRFFCRNPHDAEDVMQDVLTSLARVITEFEGRSTLSTWAYVVARNACARIRRRRVGEPENLESLDDAGEGAPARMVPDQSADPERRTARSELRQALARAIVELPAAQREVLILRDVEGLPANAAARILGLQERALKSRLHRARVELRRKLAVFGNGHGPEPARGPGRCPDVASLLSRYLEGDLDGSICRQLEAHVGGCGRCEDVCRSLRKSLTLCRAAGRERPPAWLKDGVRQALREVAATRPSLRAAAEPPAPRAPAGRPAGRGSAQRPAPRPPAGRTRGG